MMASPALAQVAPDAATAQESVADSAGPNVEQPPAAAPALQPGDRVIVTARRVEEDVQDVPIPVA
ncbi:MAG: hypothetical protein EON93_23745, partial [Burkholderiales bacterium]